MESVIVQISKMGDESDYSSYTGIPLLNYILNLIQYSCLKDNFIHRQNYRGSSMLILT